ncbi:MAG: CHAT domain-containing protein, partial [Cyanobacteria bacterium J06632_22]
PRWDRSPLEADYEQALNSYWQALQQHRTQSNEIEESIDLFYLGRVYHRQGRYRSAILYYRRALSRLNFIATSDDSVLSLKSRLLENLAFIYLEFDNNPQAETILQALIELHQTYETASETHGRALLHLALINSERGEFTRAIEGLDDAFWVFLQRRDRGRQALVSLNLGQVYVQLGQYKNAQNAFQAVLQVVDGDAYYLDYASSALGNLGALRFLQGQYSQALAFYRQAIALQEQDPDPRSVVRVSSLLSEMAYVHRQQNNPDLSLALFQEALQVANQLETRDEKIDIYNGIGLLHRDSNQIQGAWENHSRAVRIAIPAQNHLQTITTQLYTAELLEAEHPELSVAFYKQAINNIETIRSNIRSLPLETQKRYTDTVSASYRDLAALLLKQERVFEAQQVLDLLKIQELESYLQNVRDERPQETLAYLPAEQVLLEQYQALLLNQLTETDPVLSLKAFLADPVVVEALGTLQRAGQDNSLQPESLKKLQHTLQELPHNSAVLYPLVLEDRLELLLVTAAGIPQHRSVPVNKAQLKAAVSNLRHELEDPAGSVKPIASELYDWLIRPLKSELTDIENMIYIPDSVLHYVPLSVLYDNHTHQWLVEQYSSHNLTASSVGNLSDAPQPQLKVLAGAFTDAQTEPFNQQIGERTVPFYGLTYAKQEVDFLQRTLPETVVLEDTHFTRNNLQIHLQEQNILHLATHAAFFPGRPEASFILLGDGDVMTMDELRHWSLPGVDLVVLSACQTAIGHIEDGLEILGMGFQLQRTEAAATLASFWKVDDRSAAWLMQVFYTNLNQGMTKTEALRQAQVTLIEQGRSEPSHWAPFVIIGNGL